MIHRNRASACACVIERVTPNCQARKRVIVFCPFADRRVSGFVKLLRRWRCCVLLVLRGVSQAYAGIYRFFHRWARGRKFRIINVGQVVACRRAESTGNSHSVEVFGYEFSPLAVAVPAARWLGGPYFFVRLFF
jgi:hypothetical protein